MEMGRLIKEIRKTEYDHLINVQRFASTGLITCLAKAKEKIGYNKNPLSWCFDRKVAHRLDNVHEVDRLQDLIAHLTDNESTKPRLYPTQAHQTEIEPYTEGDFVCIAPTSVWSTKQWPAEKWVELIGSISSNLNIHLLGGPRDRDACEAIKQASEHKNVTNLSGDLSLLASAALIAKAKMNFVNDSAPLHLASSTNAPVRAVFCSTVPSFGFGPLSNNGKIIETELDLDCRPCGLHGKSACPEGHFNCAKSIEVERMLADLQ